MGTDAALDWMADVGAPPLIDAAGVAAGIAEALHARKGWAMARGGRSGSHPHHQTGISAVRDDWQSATTEIDMAFGNHPPMHRSSANGCAGIELAGDGNAHYLAFELDRVFIDAMIKHGVLPVWIANLCGVTSK